MFKVGDNIQSNDGLYRGTINRIGTQNFYFAVYRVSNGGLIIQDYSSLHTSDYWVLASKYPQIKTRFLEGYPL